MPKEYSDTWLRLWREEAGLSQGELADAVGRSKVSVNHLERGQKEPSSATAQLIVAALERELRVGLQVEDVFPTRGIQTPREAAVMYQTLVRRHMRDEEEARDALDGVPDVVSEDEYERDMAWLESAQNEAAEEQYYQRQNPATYKPLTVVLSDGRRIHERPPAWFRSRMREARPRPSRAKRTRSRSRSSSSSDDPGEPEPARRGQQVVDHFAGVPTPPAGAERRDACSPLRSASLAARPQGARS
jgi:transcriptional regulator with XRE-family HTH domain